MLAWKCCFLCRPAGAIIRWRLLVCLFCFVCSRSDLWPTNNYLPQLTESCMSASILRASLQAVIDEAVLLPAIKLSEDQFLRLLLSVEEEYGERHHHR